MKKVLVGMSGGVDSSVAALLLKNQGYEVIGATMVLFDDKTSKMVVDAKLVCDKIGIKHYVIDLKDTFKTYVVNDFISCYKKGLTPNPCVLCNKYLKFGVLFKKARDLGCDYIATGHYARQRGGKLMRSSSLDKDQSYFLYGISKDVISHVIFPLEKYQSKVEIRAIAEDNDLLVARKKDSQEICFVPDDDYAGFLKKNVKELPKSGDFVDEEGNVLGKHKGIYNYTIGQRKGLGVSYKVPLYVIKIDPVTNKITLGEENKLYKRELVCANINLLVDKLPPKVEAKIRFRAKPAKAKIEFINDDKIKVIFDEPQRAITKGQSVVFYEGDVVLGGGVII